MCSDGQSGCTAARTAARCPPSVDAGIAWQKKGVDALMENLDTPEFDRLIQVGTLAGQPIERLNWCDPGLHSDLRHQAGHLGGETAST